MNDLSNKKVGDPVYDALGGEWKIVDQDTKTSWSFQIKNDEGDLLWSTREGRVISTSPPCFFAEPVRIIPAQGECDFSGYEVGDDEVYTLDGCGRHISQITESGVWVTGFGYANLDGRFADRQLLFHAPPNPVASNPDAFKVPAHIAERKKAVDWANVPIDTLVEFQNDFGERHLRYFAGATDGLVYFWRDGATSITAQGQRKSCLPNEIRLAEGDKQ